ncbi:MAG: MBL fold metallo-hydrolase [Promethearchaeota archaeon]
MSSSPPSSIYEPVTLTPYSSRVVYINDKDRWDLNAAAVILDTFIVVIDPMMYPNQARAFRNQLETIYRLPVKYLFISHEHADHVWGMGGFLDKDVEIIAHIKLAEFLKEKFATAWNQQVIDEWKVEEPEMVPMLELMTFKVPTITFEDKYVVQDGELSVEFYHSGGHTGTSSYAYFPSEKILFGADEVNAHIWPFISDPTGSPERWITFYNKILDMDIQKIIPGHGPLVGKDHIREHLDFLLKLKSAVNTELAAGRELTVENVPEFGCPPAEEWQIPKAVEFLNKFYNSESKS